MGWLDWLHRRNSPESEAQQRIQRMRQDVAGEWIGPHSDREQRRDMELEDINIGEVPQDLTESGFRSMSQRPPMLDYSPTRHGTPPVSPTSPLAGDSTGEYDLRISGALDNRGIRFGKDGPIPAYPTAEELRRHDRGLEASYQTPIDSPREALPYDVPQGEPSRWRRADITQQWTPADEEIRRQQTMRARLLRGVGENGWVPETDIAHHEGDLQYPRLAEGFNEYLAGNNHYHTPGYRHSDIPGTRYAVGDRQTGDDEGYIKEPMLEPEYEDRFGTYGNIDTMGNQLDPAHLFVKNGRFTGTVVNPPLTPPRRTSAPMEAFGNSGSEIARDSRPYNPMPFSGRGRMDSDDESMEDLPARPGFFQRARNWLGDRFGGNRPPDYVPLSGAAENEAQYLQGTAEQAPPQQGQPTAGMDGSVDAYLPWVAMYAAQRMPQPSVNPGVQFEGMGSPQATPLVTDQNKRPDSWIG